PRNANGGGTRLRRSHVPAPRRRPDHIGFGCRMLNVAPCGSSITANRPTLGMSVGSRLILAPSDFAFAAVASQSVTLKYVIHIDGVPGGTSFGIAIMPPAPFWSSLPRWNTT